MAINTMIKKVMEQHKKKVELIQWGIMSGISSLVYSEYLNNMKQKYSPVRIIMVPTINSVREYLDPENDFMKKISYNLIDRIIDSNVFREFKNAPEFILFSDEYIEILKTIFDLYIIPNIHRRIPEVISMKFDLENPDQQLFRESRELDLFNRKPLSGKHFDFIIDETILQLLLLIPTMKKDIELIEDNSKFHLSEKEILTIGNEKAICPIHFTSKIINNEAVSNLLKFVTSTEINYIGDGDKVGVKNNRKIEFVISTNPFNQVCITRLNGIEISSS